MAEGGNNNGGVAAASEAVAAEAANAEDYLTTPMSEPDVVAKLSTMASDLKHVLELNNVARAVIAQLGKKHVKTAGTFATMATDEAGMRRWVTDALGLNANHDEFFVLISGIISSWLTIKAREWIGGGQRRPSREPRVVPG